MLGSAKSYAEENGFGNVQEFIKETIREKIFDSGELSKEELHLIKKLTKISEEKNLFGTEEELFEKLEK